MTTQLPTRQQIDNAGDIDFNATRSEKQANISITIAPDGLHITAEYTGTLSSIPAAIERLRAAGVLELVSPAKPTHTAPIGNGNRPKAERITPAYDGSGQPMCPVHRKALSEGQYGLFCSAKAAAGDVQNSKGYCNIRFSE